MLCMEAVWSLVAPNGSQINGLTLIQIISVKFATSSWFHNTQRTEMMD